MKKRTFVLSLLSSATAALVSVMSMPSAQAVFTVEMNGRKSHDGRAKVNMTFDSDEVGRRLDNSYFYRAAKPSKGLDGDLDGLVSLTVTDLTDSLLSFDVKVLNKTSPDFNAAIVSLWLGISEKVNFVNIVQDGDVFQKAQKINRVPGFADGQGVCFSASGCGAKYTPVNSGLVALSDSFKVHLSGEFGEAGSGFGQVTLTDVGTRWKTRQHGSYNVAGVPEPVTILGSGAALAFGALMKRRLGKEEEA